VAVVLVFMWLWQTYGGWIRVRAADDSPTAPDAVFVGPRGARHALADYRGRVVVLNLWASWCGPCVREIPALASLGERFRDDGVVVLGVNAEDVALDDLERIAAELSIPYPVVHPALPLGPPLVARGVIPHTWIVDRAGRVRASHAGAASGAAFARAIRAVLDDE
jgi:thiol-disulfide isomerase/thioredoxin